MGADGLLLPSTGRQLAVRRLGPGLTQVGSAVYAHPPGPVPLGALLTTSRLWLGTRSWWRWCPWTRGRGSGRGAAARGSPGCGRRAATGPRRRSGCAPLEQEAPGLLDLHEAARVLSGGDLPARSTPSVSWRECWRRGGPLAEAARAVLRRLPRTGPEVRRRAFQVLAAHERETRFGATLRRFLRAPGCCWIGARARCWSSRTSRTRGSGLPARGGRGARAREGGGRRRAGGLAALLPGGVRRRAPTRFRRLRAFFVRMLLSGCRPAVLRAAAPPWRG